MGKLDHCLYPDEDELKENQQNAEQRAPKPPEPPMQSGRCCPSSWTLDRLPTSSKYNHRQWWLHIVIMRWVTWIVATTLRRVLHHPRLSSCTSPTYWVQGLSWPRWQWRARECSVGIHEGACESWWLYGCAPNLVWVLGSVLFWGRRILQMWSHCINKWQWRPGAQGTAYVY